MANPEIQLAVERALSKLVNRFGPPSEVIAELERALKLMKREEVPASSSGRDAAPPEPTTLAAPEVPEPEAVESEEAEPPPTQAPKKRSTGRKK